MSDEDSETMGDYWRGVKPFLKEQSQKKRANNRESSAELLKTAGIPFVSKNDGAHLIVDERCDFWPGTGLWMVRGSGRKNRGVQNLIGFLKRFPKI